MGERRMGKDDGQRGEATRSTRLHCERSEVAGVDESDSGDADGEQEKRQGRYGCKCPNNPQHTGPDLPQHAIVGARTTLSVFFCLSILLCTIPFFSRIIPTAPI